MTSQALFQYLNMKIGVLDICNIFLEKIIFDYLQQQLQVQLFSFICYLSVNCMYGLWLEIASDKKKRNGGLKEIETLQESHYCCAYSVYVKSSDKEH